MKILTDLTKDLTDLGKTRLPKGLHDDLVALANVGKSLKPEVLFAEFLFIGKGIAYVEPHIDALRQLSKAIDGLGKERIPKGLTADLSALAAVGRDLHPEVIFAAFLYIGKGIEFVKPHIADLDDLGKAIDRLGKLRLPKGLSDDLHALASLGKQTIGVAIFSIFFIIEKGIKLIAPQLHVLKELHDCLADLAKVKAPKAVTDDIVDIAKSLGKIGSDIKDCLKSLETTALKSGKTIIDNLARGIALGASAIKVAFGKVGIDVGTGGTAGGGHAGGKTGIELKMKLVDEAVMANVRLGRLLLTEQAMAQHEAQMTSLLLQTLQVDRLQLAEARQQTELLRKIYQEQLKPKTLKVKESPGQSGSPRGGKGKKDAEFASAVLS